MKGPGQKIQITSLDIARNPKEAYDHHSKNTG